MSHHDKTLTVRTRIFLLNTGVFLHFASSGLFEENSSLSWHDLSSLSDEDRGTC